MRSLQNFQDYLLVHKQLSRNMLKLNCCVHMCNVLYYSETFCGIAFLSVQKHIIILNIICWLRFVKDWCFSVDKVL